MKDIDLLPEWYKSGKRKEVSLQGLYLVVMAMLLVFIAVTFISGSSVSRAQAKVSQQREKKIRAEEILHEAGQLEKQIQQLNQKDRLISEIDSGLNIPSVISELSFLVGRNTVLSEIAFEAQEPQSSQQKKEKDTRIRVANKTLSKDSFRTLGNVRFKVTIKGIAVDTSDVGELVQKLEQSEYFCSVSLSFSRNKKFNTGTKDDSQEKQVSEFEISCYLANYSISDK